MPLIYKYLPPERVGFFDDGLLRMTQPGDLNDPFECLSFCLNMDPVTCIESDLNRRRQECETVSGQQINPLIFDLIKRGMLDVARTEKTRIDWATSCFKAFIDFVNSHWGIVSFSKTWQSSTMWAHYAASHQGFCIGIEQPYTSILLDQPNISCGNFHEVQYQETRSCKNVTTKVTVEPHTLFIKSKDWEYEMELRVIFELANADQQLKSLSQRNFPVFLKNFSLDTIREIFLGYYTNDPLRKRILQFAADHPGIAVYQMQPSLSSNFSMERLLLEEVVPK